MRVRRILRGRSLSRISRRYSLGTSRVRSFEKWISEHHKFYGMSDVTHSIAIARYFEGVRCAKQECHEANFETGDGYSRVGCVTPKAAARTPVTNPRAYNFTSSYAALDDINV